MSELLTITVEMTPPLALSPNRGKGRGGGKWQAKSAEAELKKATNAAITNARAAYPGRMPEPFFTTPVRCQVTVYRKKGAQAWDGDNLHAALKRAAYDVLQSQGIVANDRLLRHMPPKWEKDPEGLGYMEITLSKCEENE